MYCQSWKHMDRKFGHRKIKWKIDNYNMVSACEKWKICSPQFYIPGKKLTKWQMELEKKLVSPKVFFSLKLLDSYPHKYLPHNYELMGECELCINDEKEILTTQFKFVKTYLKKLEVDCQLLNVNNVSDYRLNIDLDLFVRFEGVEEDVSPCNDASVKLLSDALYNLYERELHWDVKLFVGDGTQYFLCAHRAILYCRNAKWKKMISSNESSKEFYFDRFSRYLACHKILRFLYSASMRHVLDVPMKSVFELASAYDISPITAYYAPDELTLYTEVITGRFDATWLIHDTLIRREKFLALEIPEVAGCTSTECILNFFPFSVENSNYFGIMVEFPQGGENIVSVEISAKTEHPEIEFRKVYRTQNEDCLNDGKFLHKDVLRRSDTNGTLMLSFKVRWISSNILGFPETKHSVGTNTVTCRPYSEQENYQHLSDDLSQLYLSGKFETLGFDFCSERFTVNLGIFAARCPDFYVEAQPNNLAGFPFYKPKSLKKLINFIYCCKSGESIDCDEFISLAVFAHVFRLNNVKYLLLHIFELLLKRVDEASKWQFQKLMNKLLRY